MSMPNRCLRGHFVGDTACRVCEPWTGWTAENGYQVTTPTVGNCTYCGEPIYGGPGCYHDVKGRENCPARRVAEFHELPPTEDEAVDIDELFSKLRPDLPVSVGPRHRRPVKRWWKRR
jgi:hypothetical protein